LKKSRKKIKKVAVNRHLRERNLLETSTQEKIMTHKRDIPENIGLAVRLIIAVIRRNSGKQTGYQDESTLNYVDSGRR
jgi:hypothetical protein